MAKRNKNKSNKKANRARPRAQERIEEPESRPESIAIQDKRLVYAGGAAVIVILVAVIWFVIHRSSEESVRQSSPPRAKWLDQATESSANRSGAAKDSSTESWTPENSQSAIGSAASTRVLRDPLKSGGEGPELIMIAAGSFRMGDVQDGRDKSAQPIRLVKIQKPLRHWPVRSDF